MMARVERSNIRRRKIVQNRLAHFIVAAGLLIGLVGVIVGCNTSAPQPTLPPQPTTPPQATAKPVATTAPAVVDGAALLESRCTVCHTLDRVKRGGKNKDQWAATVAQMIRNGAKLTQTEQIVLIDYLAKTYP
jgi:cytochrome c5